jgi:hypothetical protein
MVPFGVDLAQSWRNWDHVDSMCTEVQDKMLDTPRSELMRVTGAYRAFVSEALTDNFREDKR